MTLHLSLVGLCLHDKFMYEAFLYRTGLVLHHLRKFLCLFFNVALSGERYVAWLFDGYGEPAAVPIPERDFAMLRSEHRQAFELMASELFIFNTLQSLSLLKCLLIFSNISGKLSITSCFFSKYINAR